MSQTQSLGVLAYASPGMRISPRRTVPRLCFAALRWVVRKAFACIRLAILLIAYGILAASIALRVLLTALAIALLYLGGLRWERIKARSMGAAHWIDDRTLRAVHFLRAPLASRA